jgi:hypothetical protein
MSVGTLLPFSSRRRQTSLFNIANCRTALQPTFGKLYKVFNVKYVFLIAISIFESPPPKKLVYLIPSRLPNLCLGTNLRSPHRRSCNRWCRRWRNLLRSLNYHLICRPSSSTTHVLCCHRNSQRCRLGRWSPCRWCVYRTCLLAMVFLHQLTNWCNHYCYNCFSAASAETEVDLVTSQGEV